MRGQLIASESYTPIWNISLHKKIYSCGTFGYWRVSVFLEKMSKFSKTYSSKAWKVCSQDFHALWKSRGYLLNFIVYTGVATQYPDLPNVLPMEFNKYKFPSIVILSLLPDYLNKSSRTSHCFDFIWHWLLRRHFS